MSKQRVYSVGVWICASAYIRADSKEEAAEIARNLHLTELEFSDCEAGGDDIVISSKRLSDPELPDVSLSPVMSLYGPIAIDTNQVDSPTPVEQVLKLIDLAEGYEL